MNAIGFVFSILSILSIGAFLSLEKQVGAGRLRSSYLGHLYANREILAQCESEFYNSLEHIPTPSEKEKKQTETTVQEKEPLPPSAINPDCARLNLSPLIERNKKEEPLLYDLTAKLLKTFYGKTLFEGRVRAEYRFLDAFLQATRERLMQEGPFALEKIEFQDSSLQSLYYKMLKGTKNSDPYPSLLEYIKVEPVPAKVCIFHAHPNLLSVFFSSKAALQLYKVLHTPKAPMPSRDTIERICLEAHYILDPKIFDLLDLSRSNHPMGTKTTLIGLDTDTQISVKKTITLPK